MEDHVADVGEMIGLGKGAGREFSSYRLSRYACYIITQNGDPRKKEIAAAQEYFAVKTMDIWVFMGVCGKKKKGLQDKDQLLDNIGSEELIANLFRTS